MKIRELLKKAGALWKSFLAAWKAYPWQEAAEKLRVWLTKDVQLRLSALGISLVIWFIVAQVLDPESTSTIDNVPVVIDTAGTTAEEFGLKVIEGYNQTISVQIKGKGYEISNLTANDFLATASLDGVVRAGSYTLNVKVESRSPAIVLTDIVPRPSSITAVFDKVVSRDFVLNAAAPKVRPMEGFIIDTQQLSVSPTKITITGPEESLNQIASCVVNSVLDDEISESHITAGELLLLDENGSKIVDERLNWDAVNYTVSIPVYMKKTLPLIVEFRNVPSGFPIDELKYELSASTIDLAAPSDSIRQLNQYSLAIIDFRQIGVGSQFDLEVSLPSNYRDLSNLGSVRVTFPDEDVFAMKTLDLKSFNITNRPADYSANVTDTALRNVLFIGPPETLEELTPLDVSATVDLLNVNIYDGILPVPVEISVPGKGLVWAYGNYTVNVNLQKKNE